MGCTAAVRRSTPTPSTPSPHCSKHGLTQHVVVHVTDTTQAHSDAPTSAPSRDLRVCADAGSGGWRAGPPHPCRRRSAGPGPAPRAAARRARPAGALFWSRRRRRATGGRAGGQALVPAENLFSCICAMAWRFPAIGATVPVTVSARWRGGSRRSRTFLTATPAPPRAVRYRRGRYRRPLVGFASVTVPTPRERSACRLLPCRRRVEGVGVEKRPPSARRCASSGPSAGGADDAEGPRHRELQFDVRRQPSASRAGLERSADLVPRPLREGGD